MTFQKNLGFGLDVESAQPSAGGSPFDLTDLLRIVRVRRQLIIGTVATVVTVTLMYLLQLTPLYTARAVVMLDQRENKVVDVSAVIAGLSSDPTTIQNQVQILQSRELIARVIDKLHLDQDPEFGGGPVTMPKHSFLHYFNPMAYLTTEKTETPDQLRAQQRNDEIDSLLGGETVTVEGDSTAISINFTSSSPDKAATIANAIADAYVEDQLNAKFEATQKTSAWLADRLRQLSQQAQIAEAAVQQYKADNNINETATGSSVVEEQLAQINGQLVLAKSDLAEQEAKYSRVLELQRTGHSDDVSQVVASPLIGQLRGQETDLIRQEAELNARYGPRHPKMLDLEAEKKNLLLKIDDEVQRVIETVASDVAVARAHVSSLEGSLSQIEGATSAQNKASVKLTQLQATATSTRSLYEAFLGRFKEAQNQQGIETPDSRVISRAEVPGGPSFPNKEYTIGIAIPAGIFLGLLLALVAERLDPGFRTNIQLEKMIGLPVLAALPELSGTERGRKPADAIVDEPLGAYAESLRGLRIGLAQSNVDRKVKVVLVTSSVPEEGKSTVALSLARLAAKSGQKVALIDADLRHPSIARQLGIKEVKKSLIDVLSGDAALDDCTTKDPKSSVVTLLTTRAAGNPPDLLGSKAMEGVVGALGKVFDLVVIDSAPLLAVHDARVLSRLADAVLFVVRWEQTPRDAVSVAARTLADLKTHVAGVALTRTDATRYKYYAFGYQDYSSYNKYYD